MVFYKLLYILPPTDGSETPVVSGKVIGKLKKCLAVRKAISSDSMKSGS